MSKIRFVLHAGMGKTGTSTIQHFLYLSTEELKSQGVLYLGRWLDFLDPEFFHWAGHRAVTELDPKEIDKLAVQLHKFIVNQHQQHAYQTFVFSNEDVAIHCASFGRLVEYLRDNGIGVQVVIYVRDPRTWLTSAFNQWGIMFRNYEGGFRSFEERSRDLIEWYSGPIDWLQTMPDETNVRSYESCEDVISDFCSLISIPKPVKVERRNQTEPSDDYVLRALFAMLEEDKYRSWKFDNTVGADSQNIPTVNEIARGAFDFTPIDKILVENDSLFEQYVELVGFDPRSQATSVTHQPPDINALRERMIELAVGMSVNQAKRIRRLESEVAALRKDLAALRPKKRASKKRSLRSKLGISKAGK